jgi:thymidylate synthase (FAD)
MHLVNDKNLVFEQHPGILDPIKCLNLGFVRLVDFMGDDRRIVQSARVSYGSGEKSPEEDKKLINYLMKNDHTSPFEQVVFTFHVKMPIFVARQWVRHRTARLNEISGRYSVMKDDFYIPELEDIRPQSKANKQGRDENSDLSIETKQAIHDQMKNEHTWSYSNYEEYINDGVAKEIARINLPLSLYTEMYWQIDLHNLFHFLRLRLDSHAQKEIRVYGEAMSSIIKKIVPVAYEAFEEHILNSVKVSKSEYAELLDYKNKYLSQME